MRLLCYLGLHDWRRLNHGPSLAPFSDMAARECKRCPRFEVYVFGRSYRTSRAGFENIRPDPHG